MTNYVKDYTSGQEIAFYHEDTLNGERQTFDGASEEDVLKVLVDRMKYLKKRADCKVYNTVIEKLEESLILLLAHKALLEGN